MDAKPGPEIRNGHAKDAGKVLCIVLGIIIAVVLLAVVIYMAQVRYVVRWRAAHPDKVLTLADRSRPQVVFAYSRIPDSALPKGAVRSPVSSNPIIDQVDLGTPAVQERAVTDARAVDLLAPLLGLPPAYVFDVVRVPYSGTGPIMGCKIEPPQTSTTDSAASADALPTITPHENRCIATGVLFLAPGGGIRFPYFPVVVSGIPGRAVVMFHVTPSGHRDPRSIFSVQPGSHAVLVHFQKALLPSPDAGL